MSLIAASPTSTAKALRTWAAGVGIVPAQIVRAVEIVAAEDVLEAVVAAVAVAAAVVPVGAAEDAGADLVAGTAGRGTKTFVPLILYGLNCKSRDKSCGFFSWARKTLRRAQRRRVTSSKICSPP